MRRRVIAAVAGGALLVALAAVCADKPVCKVGSVKTDGGHVYNCEDNGNGPQWVRHVLVVVTVTPTRAVPA